MPTAMLRFLPKWRVRVVITISVFTGSVPLALCSLLNVTLDIYIFLCRFVPLPMRSYMRNVLARFPQSVRKLTIYDQLNPAYAKY
jgi:hypothetical protein